MVAKRTADLAALAAGMTLAEYAELGRLVLAKRWGDKLRYAVVVGHISNDVTDHVLRIIPPTPSETSRGRAARPSRRLPPPV